MGTYRVEWPCCESVTITEAWEPDRCPFCYEPPMEASALVLYDALNCLVALLPDPELDTDDVQRKYVTAARAALAKARGE